jgi:hypothetical protein
VEARGRRTTPPGKERAPPLSHLTAARSPSGCSHTPAKGPAGALSSHPRARRRKGAEEAVGLHSLLGDCGGRGKEKKGWGRPPPRHASPSLAGRGRRWTTCGLLQPPSSEQNREWERERVGARVSTPTGTGGFDPARLALDRRISSDGQQLAAHVRLAVGPSRAGPQ